MALAQAMDVSTRRHTASRSDESLPAKGSCPLDVVAGPHVSVLHHREGRDGSCQLDHVLLGRSGVYAVGIAPRPGDTIGTQVVGGMLSPARTELLAHGRVVNGLLDQVARRADEVLFLLADAGKTQIPVVPVLWLVGAAMPVLRRRIVIDGVAVLSAHRLRRTAARRGPVEALERYRIRCLLTERFPRLG